MRKISLTNGKLTVEILPDCGGAISVLRWMDTHRRPFDLLRPARENEIASQLAGGLSCVPVMPFATPGNLSAHQQAAGFVHADLAEWTVQDASNIRATLTLHKDAGEDESLLSSCQLLQRFELGPEGLRIQLTITNIGVRPMPARAGLRLRPDLRGAGVLRAAVSHLEMSGPDPQNRPPDNAAALTPGGLAAGYRLGEQAQHVILNHVRGDIHYEWPEDSLALAVAPLQGFEFIGLDYNPAQQAIWLTPLSHIAADPAGVAGGHLLQQGDSLSAVLLLSAVPLAV